MSAVGYAVLPITPSLAGITKTLNQELMRPAQAAAKRASGDIEKALADGAKRAAADVSKARQTEQKAAENVATAERKLSDQRSKAERDARSIESAELKLTAAREKGTADVTKAENDLAAARDAGDVDAIADAESRLSQVRARTDATVIDRENALDRARQTSEASTRKIADEESNLAQAKNEAAEASENVIAATKRYDDALDGSTGAVSDMSDELRQLQGDLMGAAGEASTFGDRMRSGLMEVGRGALLGIGAKIGTSVMSGVSSAVSGGWQAAMDIDTGTRVLEGLYDSSEAAQSMLTSLRDVAADSAIDYSSYLEASQALAYTGVQGDQAIQIMENVGLAALASGKDGGQAFETMNSALARMVNEGRVGMDSLNQLSTAGVPILSGLAEHFGVSMEEVNKMSREGAIDFEDVLSVMENATGGYFENALIAGEEASGSLENQLARAKDNIITAVGGALAPILAEMDFEAIGDTVADLAASAMSLVEPLLAIGTWMLDNRDWLLPLAGTIGGIVVAVKTWTIAQAALNAVMRANPIGLIATAVTGLVAGLAYFFTQTEWGQAIWAGFMDTLSTAAEWLSDTLGPIWDTITDAWGVAMDWISEKFTEIGEGIGHFYQTWIAPLIGWFTEAGEGMSGFAGTIMGALQPVVDFFVGVFVLHIQNAWNLVSTAISSVWNNIIRPVFDTFRSIVGLVADIATGNFENIGNRFSELGGNIRRVVMGPINVAKDLFIAVWENVGRSFDFFRDRASEVMGAVRDRIDSVVEFIRDLPGTIKGFFSDAGSWLLEAGKDIVRGLLDGAQSILSTVGEFFLDQLPGWMVDPFKWALGIESPSTVFAGFGADVGEGLVLGLEGMTSAVAGAAQGLADSTAGVAMPGIEVAASEVSAPASAASASAVPALDGAATSQAWQQAGAGVQDAAASLIDPALQSVNSGMVEVEQLSLGLSDTVTPAWQTLGGGLADTAASIIEPAMADITAGVSQYGATTATQLAGVVSPAWGQMAAGLVGTKSSVIDPAQAGLRADVTNTAATTHAQTVGSMLPSWQQTGAGIESVHHGVIDPAMAATRGAIATTEQAFAQGTAGMISEWNKLREGTAAPARFAINTVFSDGIVGMWNSVAEMVGLNRMEARRANFWAGGVLPGYTPGRDPFTFVEPRTGMSIGLGGGEAIMRPEWTKAVGPEAVEAMNAAARMGGAGAVRRLLAPHGGNDFQFARGGVFGGPHLGNFSQGAVIDSMSAFVNRFFPELQLTSGWRFTDSGYHSRGLAGDYSNQSSGGPPTPASIGLARAIYRNFAGQTAQLIHAPLQGWQNLLNGQPFSYGAATDRQHWDHVHWALERPLMAAGVDLDLSGGVGAVIDPREIVESMVGDVMGDTQSAVDGFQGSGGAVDAMPGAIWEAMRDATLDTLVEAFESFGGDPGGTDVARWRPLAMQALARHGYDAAQHIDAMMEQIRIESGGDPRALNLWDSNAAMGDPSGGLLQVIGGTYRRVRSAYPEAFAGLPDDRWHPLTNLTAGVGAVRMDWGGPAGRWPTTGGYDQGGWLPPTPGGYGTYYNHTGDVEAVLTNPQWRGIYNLVTVTAELLDPLRRLARDGRDMARHIEEVAGNTRRQVQAGIDAAGLAVWEALPGEMQDTILAANAAGRMWHEISDRIADKAIAWSKGEWPIGSARVPTVEPGPGWQQFRLDDSLQDVARANLDLAEAVITGELSAGSDPVANALYDIFGRDPILPDLARIAAGGENAIVAATEAAWHAFETGETARLEEWTDSQSQLTEAVLRARDAAIHTGQMVEGAVNGYLNWAMASDSQGRMGSWQEYFQHYGGMYGTAEGDWLLSQVGLGGILGGKFKDSFANLLIETAQSPLLAAPEILDDDGRVIGTQLQSAAADAGPRVADTTEEDDDAAEPVTASLPEPAPLEAEPAGKSSIQVEVTLPEGKSAFTAEEVEGMLSQINEDVDEISIKVNRMESESASVTSGVQMMV